MASSLNLASLKTPGVYIEEVSLFPPSVAQVDTAIPAFVGYTEIALKNGKSITGIPTQIKSMVEFRKYFGQAANREIQITLNALNNIEGAEVGTKKYLYDSLLMFFANGGEKCYIISVGGFSAAPQISHFTDAFEQLKKYDEPTLIVMPDLMRFEGTDINHIGTVQQAAIDHCTKMQDRFAVLDVQIANKNLEDVADTDIETFRAGIGNHLKYAAAYYPWLCTSLPVNPTFRAITLQKAGATISLDSILEGNSKVIATNARILAEFVALVEGSVPDNAAYFNEGVDEIGKTARLAIIQNNVDAFTNHLNDFLTNKVPLLSNDSPNKLRDVVTVFIASHQTKVTSLNTVIGGLDNAGASPLVEYNQAFGQVEALFTSLIASIENSLKGVETDLLAKVPLYSNLVAAANAKGVVIPPSGAIVGVYAATDNNRGVWKAPANVLINNVLRPTVFVDDDVQENLNVDTTAGKSINAIRQFTGKGTLVWGARTLAGNDNEWRYVSVRRFFNMVEESVKKASSQFVFEPNDANTWVRVRAMIENFLTLQWRAGALAGVKADHAFYVRVGLGQTMTAEDILNGFLIVEIGMAVVRPAEFIILRFSHKMQES
ncbi:phage tail sheath C-terminal domain-containing protein [Runella sp. MFBS21]|uniref:phage tail sheath family protein n=1 Tax=Runella sp. MFBS21 TaxID=3034018 RepID=UPI0023FA041D|nr:phage tail sheath C-terminal domain-containing protein [Runella sp. MFBS21]MDF7816967.1 phage tail sheath C-terminal domain-containing protein [Runella sp. MFBS21]